MPPDRGAGPVFAGPGQVDKTSLSPPIHGHVLVTGAGGKVGRALAARLPDALLLGRSDLDVTDEAAVGKTIRDARPTVVIHTAAWTRVDAAERDPEGARRVNADATRSLAEAAATIDALFVYLSTDYVFSGRARRPYRETDRTSPLSVYGMTKLQGEEAARRCERHLVVRTSWLFGEGPNFVLTILSAARERTDLPVVSDQIGLPTYAPYLAEGILELVERGAAGTFHLAGGGDPCSWADLAEAALQTASATSRLSSSASIRPVTTAEYVRRRALPLARRPSFSVLDCSKAKGRGVILRPWREGLREYIESLPPRAYSGTRAAGGER